MSILNAYIEEVIKLEYLKLILVWSRISWTIDDVFIIFSICTRRSLDISDDDKAAADFLVGIHGRLFQISTNDWQVNEYDKYTAIGSGNSYAIGSLDTSYTWKDPIKKIKTALESAIKNSPQCDYPIDILHS